MEPWGERWNRNDGEVVIPLQTCMEQVLQKRSKQAWDSRMGREEMAGSGFLMEEDVELHSGFDLDLSPAGLLKVGSDELQDRRELDWRAISRHTDSLSPCEEQRGGDGGRPQEEREIDADSMKIVDLESERGLEMDEEGKEEETKATLDVCLCPVEESGGHVRISLEEVERFYRFSRCCHWLCGRCQVHNILSFLYVYHKVVLPVTLSL